MFFLCSCQLSDARIEIAKLQGQCKDQQELIGRLQAELESTVDEYSTLSYQSRMVIDSSCLFVGLITDNFNSDPGESVSHVCVCRDNNL